MCSISNFYVLLKIDYPNWNKMVPYKVLAIDVVNVPNIVDLSENTNFIENSSEVALTFDKDDYEEIEKEREKVINESKSVNKVVTWFLLGNHYTGDFNWFDINSLQFINRRKYLNEVRRKSKIKSS